MLHLAFLGAGLMVLPLLPRLPPLPFLLAALLLLLCAWGCSRRAWLLPACCFLAGLGWSVAAAHRALEARIPAAWEQGAVMATGRVGGLPEPGEQGGLRFRFLPDSVVAGAAAATPGKGQWLLFSADGTGPSAGDRCRLTARLKRPHGAANPGGFDYEAWLLSEGITATGTVRALSCQATPGRSVDRMRQALREEFQRRFPERPAAGVVLALVTGDRSLVPAASWDSYTATGVVHLMAISGLHVAMLALVMFWGLRLLLRAWPRLALRMPLHKPALVAALATGLAYSLVAGYSIPTERTLVMMAVVAAAALAERQLPGLLVLLLALVLVLCWSPLAVHAAGFWLSFGAVALLMVAGGAARGLPSWRQALQLQFVLTLLLLPVTLWCFDRISWVSPFANLLAVPVVTFLVVPAGLAGLLAWLSGMPAAAALLWSGASHCIEGLDALMLQMADWPAASLAFSLPGWAGLAWLVLGLACLVQPLYLPLRLLAPVFLLPLLLPPPILQGGQLRVTVVDVGQGLGVLVETAGHRLLYDTGPPLGAHADAGERYLLPTLHRQGILSLDLLVLSHGDADHTGGAASLLAGMPVRAGLGAPPPAREGLRPPPWQPCRAGQRWQWDGWTFAVLYPDDEERRYAKTDNNRSCVLRISRGGTSVLLPGDLERAGELSLMARTAADELRATVLVLGHHGSRTSSSAPWLAAVRPRVALASTGYRNAFRHPSPEVLARLGAAGISWHDTASAGAVSLLLDARGLRSVQEFRNSSAGYWQRADATLEFADWGRVFTLGATGLNR